MSKFLQDLIDFDTYGFKPDGKWPSLKLVFDNLRCYPILALYGLALRFLLKAGGFWEMLAFWFLIPILMVIGLACLAQTAFLFSALALGILSEYVQPSKGAREALLRNEALVDRVAYVLFVVLLAVSFVAAMNLLNALARIAPGV